MHTEPNQLREKVINLLGVDIHALEAANIATELIHELEFGSASKITITTECKNELSGLLLKPWHHNNPAPAILYCHAHGNRYDIGAQELLSGRPALYRPYADDLLRLEFTVLCLDMPCFGSRKSSSESALSKAMLWQGKTLFGTMLQELNLGMKVLADMPFIDPSRIATMGISMGGTHAWWLAAIAPQINAAVHMSCFADLNCLINSGAHEGHGHYMTVPGLLPLCSTGKLAGLIAPRPQLVCVGLQDWSTPQPCFDIVKADLEKTYENGPHALEFYIEDDLGHEESDGMRKKVLDFLQERI